MAGASLRAWFASSDNKLLLNQLRQAGIRCCQEDPAAADVILSHPGDTTAAAGSSGSSSSSSGSSSDSPRQQLLEGVTVCVTGGIADPSFETRKEFGSWIQTLGGVFSEKLKKDTDILVVSAGRQGQKGWLHSVLACEMAGKPLSTPC
jgi:NAD-dependent DNA ligase